MASTVDICNRALQKLGARRIESLTENSVNARACAVAHPAVLAAELTDHPWNCAIKRVELAADATEPAFGRENYFTLPADYLRLLEPDPVDNADIDFQIEGKKIATDWAAPLYIRYIYLITDPAEMDALLVEAISAKMAFEMCEELTQSNTKKESLRADYDAAIKKAKKCNAILRVPQESPVSDWTTCRS